MKSITKTLTLRQYELRVYNHVTDELDTLTLIKSGEKPVIEKKIDSKYEVLRVLKSSEPTTAKYTMPIKRFENIANESYNYMFGFINRKIGGEVAFCKVYDLESDEIKQVSIENDTEKRLEKKLIEEKYKLIKIESIQKVDEKYYYMSDEMFASNSEEGLPQFKMSEVL